MNKIHFNNLTNLQVLLTNAESRGIPNEDLPSISLNTQQAEILAAIDTSLTSLEIPQAWINFYPIGRGNEIHNHEPFSDRSDHLAIFILESGSTPEKFLCEDSSKNIQEYDAIAGDCFIIKNSEMHGLKDCIAPLAAVIFLLKTK